MMHHKTKIIIGIGVGAPLVLLIVLWLISPLSMHCSQGGAQYVPYNTGHATNTSKVTVIGTVTDVKVRIVEEFVTSTYPFPNLKYESLFKFVTVEAEEYLKDETGRHSDKITFRARTNGCLDFFGRFIPPTNRDYVEYGIGERSLFFLADVEGNLESMSIYKFDIQGEMVQNKYNEITGKPPMNLADLKAEIKMIVERQDG